MGESTTVVWFRRNLRLDDNQALVAAAKLGKVVPVFIWCPEEEGEFQPGRVSRWWLKESLVHLSLGLSRLGAPLILRRASDSLDTLLEIVRLTSATRVFFNHLYDPVSLMRDHKVKKGLSQQGILVQSFKGDLLYEPWEIYDEHGRAFTTFSSFWEKCLDMPSEPEPPVLPPRRLVPFPGKIPTSSLDNLGLEDELEKSSNALLSRNWSPGWPNADKALEAFVSGPLCNYAINRRKADSTTTSLLSPHLHFGEISVRKVFHTVRMQQLRWVREGVEGAEESVNKFLRSLGFREYSRYLCFNFPFTHEKSLLANLKHFPWRVDEGYFKLWRQGRTGYPLVDAGMRELWATGWLHCRIRVVVSSFFVKFLQLPWRWGMKYFWDTLLDADLENDILGWQYISGSLPDGHELDRFEDPEKEGYKLDPEGEYVRKWLPELSRVPTVWIHHPWDAPSSILRAAGVELGSNYPRPIVEIAAARERQKQALAMMWQLDADAKLRNGVEREDTMEVSGTGGPMHQKMDVHRVYIVRNDNNCNKRQQSTASCSLYDQRVPSFQRQKLQTDQPGAAVMKVDSKEESSSSSSAKTTKAKDEDVTVKNGVPAGYVHTRQETESRVPEVRCDLELRTQLQLKIEEESKQSAWMKRHLKRKL